MVELSLSSDSSVSLGFAGDTLNTAIYLKRLIGNNAEVAYCTTLGKDPLSSKLVDLIESESISTTHISYSEAKTVGLYAISTDASGERTFTYWRSDSAARTLFNETGAPDFSRLNDFNTIYFSAITLAILPAKMRSALLEKLETLRLENQTIIVFDSNYRPALWESEAVARETVAHAWRITDIALPSVDDEIALFGDKDESAVLDRLQQFGVKNGALKRGETGPLSLNPAFSNDPQPDYPAALQVRDTTAAGDSFNGGYLSAALTGKGDIESLMTGHDCARKVVGCNGGIVPLGHWTELNTPPV